MSTSDTLASSVHSIRFSLSRWDVLRCRLWVLSHNKMLMTFMFLACLPVPIMACRAPGASKLPMSFLIFCFMIGLALMLAFMVVIQITVQGLWVLLNKNRGVVGEHEYLIRDDGFWERTSFSESLYRWSGFHKIAASRSYLFIFVTDNNVHYVPLSIFSSQDEAWRFHAELCKRANLSGMI